MAKFVELASQAGMVRDKYGMFFARDKHNEDGVDLEKFAELIVKECVQQLEIVRKYRYDRAQLFETQQTIIDECQYQIKQFWF